MIRAVLDANVLVSAVITTTGSAARILDAWRAGQIDLVLSPSILDELGRVLQYPRIAKRHHLSGEGIREFVENLAHLALLTSGELPLSVVEKDPSDDAYLACAAKGEADFIVSGDRHLLELGQFQGIKIITPSGFLEALRVRPDT